MGKDHYIEQLKAQMHEIMERPVTLWRAEEITVYADAICALNKLDDDHFREATKMIEFTEDDAKAWTAKMKNEDGTTGTHWTMGQTDAVANITGVHVKPCTWCTAMNVMYSDYYGVAAKYGLDRTEFYADLAKAFLMDKDAGGPEAKMAGYYHVVVARANVIIIKCQNNYLIFGEKVEVQKVKNNNLTMLTICTIISSWLKK